MQNKIKITMHIYIFALKTTILSKIIVHSSDHDLDDSSPM